MDEDGGDLGSFSMGQEDSNDSIMLNSRERERSSSAAPSNTTSASHPASSTYSPSITTPKQPKLSSRKSSSKAKSKDREREKEIPQRKEEASLPSPNPNQSHPSTSTSTSSSNSSNKSGSRERDRNLVGEESLSKTARLSSVAERIGEGWARRVGSIGTSRDGNSNSGGNGDLSIPFSSLDESQGDFKRSSFNSNRTQNGQSAPSTSSPTTPSNNNQDAIKTSRRSSFKTRERDVSIGTTAASGFFGNKFGLGPTSPSSPGNTLIALEPPSSTSKPSSAASPSSPTTPGFNATSVDEKLTSKKKKRRGSKTVSSPTKDRDGEVEPASPVPPRRASLSISSSDKPRITSSNDKSKSKEVEKKDSDPSEPSAQFSSKSKPSKPSITSNPSSSSISSSFCLPLLQRYVLSIGIVNFDLDLGPDLEFLYPPLGISREERDNIAFSSFPDTSIFDDGSCVFSWRVREVPLGNSKEGPPIIGIKKEKDKELERSKERVGASDPSIKDGETIGKNSKIVVSNSNGSGRLSSNYIYGYVFFRQKRDPTIRRGYFQKSIVILSHLPYVSFFSKLTQILGTLFFERRKSNVDSGLKPNQNPNSTTSSKDLSESVLEEDMKILESFCKDVASWPSPEPGSLLTLPLPFLPPFQSPNSDPSPSYHSKYSTLLDISSLSVSIPESFGSSQTSPKNDQYLLPPSTSAAGRPNSLLISKHKNSKSSSTSNNGGSSWEREEKLKNEIGQSKENPLLASIPSRTMFDTFREALPDLWLLWECLLLADPILIMAPDPSCCSEAVWHALDLIRPIPFAGDFRPFFTMQDHDVSILVNKSKPQAGTLLGVTNPFFKQACSHWSNTLRVGKGGPSEEEREKEKERERELELEKERSRGGGFHFHSSPSHSNANGYSSISSANQMANANSIPVGRVAGGNSAGGGGPDHTPGFTTKRKRRVSKDRPLLRRLTEMAEKRDNDQAANALLRRYFTSLTELFLAPLNRYVSTLIPADFDLSSPSESPRLKPFSTADFLASLKAHGTPLPLKSKNLPTGAAIRQGLYNDFLQCPNFSMWLSERLSKAEEEQRRRRVLVLEQGDVAKFAKTRGEIESLDLYERLVEEIRRVDLKLSQPPTLGPSSRWRTDEPNKVKDQKVPTQPSQLFSLEQVTSRDSASSEKFTDARTSISTVNSQPVADSNVNTTTRRRSEDSGNQVEVMRTHLKDGTTSSGLTTSTSNSMKTNSNKSSTPINSTNLDYGRNSISSNSSHNSNSSNATFTSLSGGHINVKQLEDRKSRLLKQLEKLVDTLPQDLRGSLRVKP